MKLVIISGFSGAGKSIALHALEDEGFYCIDNLTLSLLNAMLDNLESVNQSMGKKVAVSIDVRGLGTAPEKEFIAALERIKQCQIDMEIVFVEASQKTLIRRYQAAKRPHPLANICNTLTETIALESQRLDLILRHATIVLDTSNLQYYELITQIRSQVSQSPSQISLLLQSFGYRTGVPADSNYVFDVRCLPNPYWKNQLRELTGKDSRVVEFMESHKKCIDLYEQIEIFLHTWIQEFIPQGNRNLTISLGCTGGQHRSVYMVEKLFQTFHKYPEYIMKKSHRDLSH